MVKIKKSAKRKLQEKAPKGEFLAYINKKEANLLKKLGGSGKKINGIPSFTSDTGPGGGATDVGSSHTGDSAGFGDTGTPTQSITSFSDTFGTNLSTLGPALAIPGAGIYAAAKTASDVQKGKKAMGYPTTEKYTSTTVNGSSDNSIQPLAALQPASPKEMSSFKRINFIRAKTGTSVSTRGTKSIQVQGHKKTKLY
jgi:hypothetical protein